MNTKPEPANVIPGEEIDQIAKKYWRDANVRTITEAILIKIAHEAYAAGLAANVIPPGPRPKCKTCNCEAGAKCEHMCCLEGKYCSFFPVAAPSALPPPHGLSNLPPEQMTAHSGAVHGLPEQVTAPQDLRMHAYYYGFSATGVPAIDLILSAVACAGKAYHHTDSWREECEWVPHTGNSPVEWIQNAANAAAESLRRSGAQEEPILLVALKKIAANYGGCHCDHTDADCCEKAGEFCPHCISEIAIAKAEKLRAEHNGQGWVRLPQLPPEDEKVLVAVMSEADDHSTGMTVRFPEVYRGTIYTAPGMVIADCEGGGEYEDEEILGWRPLPAPPEGQGAEKK